jgi:hypothetical protein
MPPISKLRKRAESKKNEIKAAKEGEIKKPSNQDKTHLSRRPEHEQPAKFPDGLKRPNLEAVVDGKKIAFEFQRQLFDDIKRGNCPRCHKGGYNRKDCKDPKAKWEEKFDKEKSVYWTSVLKWQQRAAEQKGTSTSTSTITTKPPTLHVKISDTKPEQRFSILGYDFDPDDDAEPMQHFRMMMHDPDDDDDDSTANTDGPVDFAHDLDEGNDLKMTDETSYNDDPPKRI